MKLELLFWHICNCIFHWCFRIVGSWLGLFFILLALEYQHDGIFTLTCKFMLYFAVLTPYFRDVLFPRVSEDCTAITFELHDVTADISIAWRTTLQPRTRNVCFGSHSRWSSESAWSCCKAKAKNTFVCRGVKETVSVETLEETVSCFIGSWIAVPAEKCMSSIMACPMHTNNIGWD